MWEIIELAKAKMLQWRCKSFRNGSELADSTCVSTGHVTTKWATCLARLAHRAHSLLSIHFVYSLNLRQFVRFNSINHFSSFLCTGPRGKRGRRGQAGSPGVPGPLVSYLWQLQRQPSSPFVATDSFSSVWSWSVALLCLKVPKRIGMNGAILVCAPPPVWGRTEPATSNRSPLAALCTCSISLYPPQILSPTNPILSSLTLSFTLYLFTLSIHRALQVNLDFRWEF